MMTTRDLAIAVTGINPDAYIEGTAIKSKATADINECILLLDRERPAPKSETDGDALADLDAMKRRLMDEADAMEPVHNPRWWWRYSQNAEDRLRSLLAAHGQGGAHVVDDLAMMIRVLAHALGPENAHYSQAIGLLRKYGLEGSPLRTDAGQGAGEEKSHGVH